MSGLAGPVAAVALLAVAAGLAKVVDPVVAVRAARETGLPANAAAVRAGAAVEAVLGVVVLVSASPVARLGLAVAYAALALFNVAALRTRTAVPCGCFGAARATVSWRHVWTCAACCVVLGVAAVAGTPSAAGLIGASAPLGFATAAVAAATAWLAATFLSGTTARPSGAALDG